MRRRRLHRPARLIVALLFCGCAGAPAEEAGSAESTATGPSIQELRRQIDEAIGEGHADDVAQCRLIAIGSRPCGGPRRYRAYSVLATDSADLAEIAEAYGRLDRQRNEERGLVSTCEVLPRPDLELREGRCVAVSGS